MDRAGRRPLPTTFPPWEAGSQQTRRWLAAGVFAAIVHDLRVRRRWLAGRADTPSAAMFDRATRQSPPERGSRAGDAGHQRRQGRTLHLAVDTLGHLLARHVTPATAQEREQVGRLAEAGQAVTGETVELAFVDQGDPGPEPAQAAAAHGIPVEVIKLAEAKQCFVLLPRRWVGERSFAWAARFRRLANDDERLPETVAGLHFVAFVCRMLHRLLILAAQSP